VDSYSVLIAFVQPKFSDTEDIFNGAHIVRKACFNFLARQALRGSRSSKCIFFKISDEKFSR